MSTNKPVSGGIHETRQQIESLEKASEFMQPDHAMEAVRNLLAILKERLDVKEELQLQTMQFKSLMKQTEGYNNRIEQATAMLTEISKQLNNIIDVLAQTRDREKQTLDKLDRYLDAWT